MSVLADYIAAGMRRARYEVIEDDGTFFGTIEGFKGL